MLYIFFYNVMSKQLSIFSNGVMQSNLMLQLQAELTAKEQIIEKQNRSLAAYKGHKTRRENK